MAFSNISISESVHSFLPYDGPLIYTHSSFIYVFIFIIYHSLEVSSILNNVWAGIEEAGNRIISSL